MRACVLVGLMALSIAGWAPAAAQLSNSPLYPPSPGASPPSDPAWQDLQDGRVGAPNYLPAPRWPTDSRNPTLDNRAPTLWPLAPDLRNATPRLGSQPANNTGGAGLRRNDDWRAPTATEPGHPGWR